MVVKSDLLFGKIEDLNPIRTVGKSPRGTTDLFRTKMVRFGTEESPRTKLRWSVSFGGGKT